MDIKEWIGEGDALEIHWGSTLSICLKQYYPQKEQKTEARRIVYRDRPSHSSSNIPQSPASFFGAIF